MGERGGKRRYHDRIARPVTVEKLCHCVYAARVKTEIGEVIGRAHRDVIRVSSERVGHVHILRTDQLARQGHFRAYSTVQGLKTLGEGRSEYSRVAALLHLARVTHVSKAKSVVKFENWPCETSQGDGEALAATDSGFVPGLFIDFRKANHSS